MASIPVPTEEQKQAAAKAEYDRLLNARSGGVYVPPAKLRALQAQITDKTSKEYQRMAWEALKKSINGLINKVSVANIKHLIPEMFHENLIRGRGVFCRSVMRAQAASLPFTPIYAALVAAVNSRLPQVGELLAKRLVMQFRKAFKRNDKSVCLSSTTFLAHLVNQQVVTEMLAGQILLLLLNKPTDDSVEIAVGLTREVGQYLCDMKPPTMANLVFDQFRHILHEANLDKRVQYMIEVLFLTRREEFRENPTIREELDIIEEEDQIKHNIFLDEAIDIEDGLNIFKFDTQWEENEAAYQQLRAEILGEGSDDEDEDDDDDDDDDDEEENAEDKAIEIKDQTNTDLVNLRKTIYLTMQSSIDPEECCHKLMKINLPPGQEPELPSMIVECCAQDKTYKKFFGLVGERFAKINRLWTDLFEQSFQKYYDTIHRFDTAKLRSIARFFGHMLASDAIGWHVLSVVHMNEDETTSSSRIFIKILFQDIAEAIGMAKLQARMREDMLQSSFSGVFPRDTPRNVRFSINYFTSIGMGALTEDMREYLQNMPKPALPAPAAPAIRNDTPDSDSESVSSYSSYSTESSRSRSPATRSRPRERSRSARGRSESYHGRDRSISHSTRPLSSSRSPSRSPPPSRSRRQARDRSRSPPRGQDRRRSDRAPRDRNGPPNRGRDRSLSERRSASPPRGQGRRRSDRALENRGGPPPNRGRDRSLSEPRSASPPPRGQGRHRSDRALENRNGPPPNRRRDRSLSEPRSVSPPPKGQGRRRSDRALENRGGPPPNRGRDRSLSEPRSASPPPKRRRRASSSSVSPPSRRRKVSDSPDGRSRSRKRRRSYNDDYNSDAGSRLHKKGKMNGSS